MKKFCHLIAALLVAQVPLLALGLVLGGIPKVSSYPDWGFYIFVLAVSTVLSLIIALPMLLILLKVHTLNIFSITGASIIVVMPVLKILNVGYISLFLFVPALLGSLVCWAYLKYVGLISEFTKRAYISSAITIIIFTFPLYLAHKVQEENDEIYETRLKKKMSSYITLDQELVRALEKDRNDSTKP